MTSDEVVLEVKERADIVSVVSRYLTLTKRGKNYIALCPFHAEKTPSFTVSQEKELFHCFGCGKGGDVFGFVMEMESIDFPEALKMLANQTGVKLPERRAGRTGKSPYADLYDLNKMAMEFYHKFLTEDNRGKDALSYLEGRGIKRDTIESFAIGFAPEEWDVLSNYACNKGVKEDLLIRNSLAARGKSGIYDYFRQRILFPIRDNRGRLAGFAGREFGGISPKYLNSPDTPIFTKRKILYGYHAARSQIRSSGEVIIVEGYTDLITLFQEGIRNVVAPMGTALTDEQASFLARNARTATLVYDCDEAGLKATFRAGDLFLKYGMGVNVAQLPEGEDPDSFVLRKGIKAFDQAVRKAQDVFDLKVRILKEKGFLESVDGRRVSTEHLLKTLAVTRDDVIKDIYLGKAAEALGLDRKTLERKLEETRSRPTKIRKRRTGSEETEFQKLEGMVERYIVQLMLMGEEFISRVHECLSGDDFSDPLMRKAFSELSGLYKTSGSLTSDKVMNEIPEDLKSLISELYLTTDEVTDPDKILQDCLRKIEAGKVKRQMQEIEEQLNGTEDDDEDLAVKYYDLKKRLVTLQSGPLSVDHKE
jgi:DNA primase